MNSKIAFLAPVIAILLAACTQTEVEEDDEYRALACKRIIDLSPSEAERAIALMRKKRERSQDEMRNMNEEKLNKYILEEKKKMKC